MSFQREKQSAFTIAGITTRTSNSRAHEIGSLWRRFHQGRDFEQIPDRVGNTIYSVYSEYESDHTGSFTVTIGCEVTESSPIPQGMTKRSVFCGDYAVFPAAKALPESIAKAWSTVWNTPLDRCYGTDFEHYTKEGDITVHVGIR